MDRRIFLQKMGAGVGVFAMTASTAKTDTGRKVLLEDFTVHKQETPYTCGPAAARMSLEYLGHKLSEAEIKKRMNTSALLGTSHGQLYRAYLKYLAEFNTGLEASIIRGVEATNRVVMESLHNNLPLIASFITENHFKPGTSVGHYAVIIGMDPAANTFTLANPFGYKETVDIDKFWRLAEWRPGPGDLPENVKVLKLPKMPFLRTLVVLARKGCACQR